MFWPLMDNRNWRGHYHNNTCIVYDKSKLNLNIRFNPLGCSYTSASI